MIAINPKNRKILIPVEEHYEDLELWYPQIRLEEEGYQTVVAGPVIRSFQGRHGLKVEPSTLFECCEETDFAGIIIPGGFAPDWMRRSQKLLQLIREFHQNNKLIAFICHAGWVPISAGILKDRKATSIPAIKDDMINAGVLWEDSPLVIDGNLVSSRRPADLPLFCRGIIKVLSEQD